MRLVPSKTPWLFKKLFPKYVWGFASTKKNNRVLYLTFDDGPIPEITPWTLKVLKQYNAKATFFCIGNNVEKYPTIFNTILEAGHSIGNHTNTHVEGWRTKTKDYIADFKKAQEIIALQIEKSKIPYLEKINLFRPPFGQLKNSQGNALIKLGYKIIMWSVVTFDWEQYISPEKCLNNVIKNAISGNIIVFHDSLKAAKNMQFALPRVLEYYSKRGFRFEAITSKHLI